MAAELGTGRERVRQFETSALQQLALAAAHDRNALSAGGAPLAARPGGAYPAAIPGTPQWQGQMLSWLAGRPA